MVVTTTITITIVIIIIIIIIIIITITSMMTTMIKLIMIRIISTEHEKLLRE